MKLQLIAAALLCFTMGTTTVQAQKTNSLLTNKKIEKKMTPREVVEAYSVALAKGDIPSAFSHFSPNAKWHQPGSNKFSGTQSGLEAIGKMLSDMMGATQGSLVIKPTGPLMANQNFVSSPVRFSARSGDKTVEMNGNDLFEVIDGKIVQVWLFSEDQNVEDEFWGK